MPSLTSLILAGPTADLQVALAQVTAEDAWETFLVLMSLPKQTEFHSADTLERLPLAYAGLKARLAPGTDLGPALLRALEWEDPETAQRLLPGVAFTSDQAPRYLRTVLGSSLAGISSVIARMSEAHLVETVQLAMVSELETMLPGMVAVAGVLPARVAERWVAELVRPPAVPGAEQFRQAWADAQRSRQRAAVLAQQPISAPAIRSRFRS